MIQYRTTVQTAPDGKELWSKDPQILDLSVNEGDIHQFVTHWVPPHWHWQLEVFVLLEGSVQMGIGTEFYELKPGEGCFINSGILHCVRGTVPEPCKYRSFVFDSGIVGGIPGSVFDAKYVRPILEQGPAFIKFEKTTGDVPFFEQFNRVFSLCENESFGYEFQIRSALSDLFLCIQEKSSLLPARKALSVQEERIRQMLEWIDQNYGKEITIQDISAAVNVCPRECQRLFARYLHYSPMECVRRKRIMAAADLLDTTAKPVTEIALECGFSNPGYFAKQFKEMAGCTPGEYRKRRN